MNVPTTPVKIGSKVHSNQDKLVGKFLAKVPQLMVIMLTATAISPCQVVICKRKKANKKTPKIPPPKIPDNCHHISKALFAEMVS